MSEHVYVWNRAIEAHACRECGRVQPQPTRADLDRANAAHDAARALGDALGVPVSVQSLAVRALGLHAMITVSTANALVNIVIARDARVYLYVNRALVESLPDNLRKARHVLDAINTAEVAHWANLQMLRYPDDTECTGGVN